MVTVGANMVDPDIPFWEGQFLGAMSILRRVIDDPRIFKMILLQSQKFKNLP